MYENKCVCGTKYDNNCAHYLANWMIEDLGLTSVKNAGAANCPAGRPIRAKEMASVPGEKKFPGVFESVLGLTKHKSPPAGGGWFSFYLQRNAKNKRIVFLNMCVNFETIQVSAIKIYFFDNFSLSF